MKTLNCLLASLCIAVLLTGFSLTIHAQIITTIAGDSVAGYNSDSIPALMAELYEPESIVLDGANNLYIDDEGNNRIRKINAAGIITTIAGTGTHGFSGDNGSATLAELNKPSGLAIDNSGNIYISDDNNFRLRKINDLGIITTIAGTGMVGHSGDGGMATNARIANSTGTAADDAGNVYFAEGDSNYIRKVSPSGIITTIAGTGVRGSTGDGGQATSAEINSPFGVAVDRAGNIYISEFFGDRIRQINTAGIITTYAGIGTGGFSGDNGMATAAELSNPADLTVVGDNLLISDNSNNRIRLVNSSGIITTIAGNGLGGFAGDGGLAIDAELNAPAKVALDNIGNMYIADWGNDRIRHITSTVSVNTLNATADRLTIYPNPSTGDFTINLSSAINEQANVLITNVEGGRVKEFSASTNRPQIVALDERTGLYFISVTTSQGTYNTKLVITQ